MWYKHLAEKICERLPGVPYHPVYLERVIREIFQARKKELVGPIYELSIRARRGDEDAARELISKLAEMPPRDKENAEEEDD